MSAIDITTILAPDAVVHNLAASSKRRAFEEIARIAAREVGVPERDVFDTLSQRERLGSTGVGNGIAIPHGKLGQLQRLCGFLFRLAEPIEFDALDAQPVDLVFALLAPEHAGADHLKALAKIAKVLRLPGMIEELREADSATALYRLVTRTAVAA